MDTPPTMDYLFFYGKNEGNGFLSNFYGSSFEYKGRKYFSVEQYMHFQKAVLFKDYEIAKKILAASTPLETKKLGRKVKGFDIQKWNENKYRIVRNGVFLKFDQNPDLKSKLLETGDKILVEAAGGRNRDAIWGIGISKTQAIESLKDGSGPDNWGENLLGKALMDVRNHFL